MRPARAPPPDTVTDHDGRRTDNRVSSNSYFNDPVWHMDGWRPGSSSRAAYQWRWDFAMANGSRFTDARWRNLALSAKCYLLSLHSDPPLGRKRVGPSTQNSRYRQLRVLIAWMGGEGLRSFAELDQPTADRFLEAVAQRPGKQGKGLAPGTVFSYATLLKTLYQQGPKISGAMPHDPFPGQNPGQVMGGHRLSMGSGPHTPDAIAVLLIARAIRLIGTPADDVIALRAAAQHTYDGFLQDGYSQTRAGIATGRSLEGYTFSTFDDEDRPWHAALPGSTKLVRQLIDRIVDACLVVIAYLAGLRISEILNLTPGCIVERPMGQGGETATYISGRIFKTALQAEGIPHLWIAPAPVVRAIAVMEKISEPYRQRSQRQELFLAMTSSGLIGPDAIVSTPIAASWNHRLSHSFASFIDLPDYQGKPWRINSHQGRKTFARFVGKRDRTGLHALQQHLGHVTRVMTDSGYVGTDFALDELVDRQTLHETHDALVALLTSRRLAGPAGRILAARSPFRGRTVDKEISAYVSWVLNETDMRLGVCDWGFCVYRRETSACRGGDKGPNPLFRTESVCQGCQNFAVTEQHAPFWEARLARNQALLQRADLDPVTRALAETRVEESRRLLKDLHHEQSKSEA